MPEFFLRLLLVLRLLCFMAVFYLALHSIFSRLISKPDSKILWFFSVLTGPLTLPVRPWFAAGATEARLRLAAMTLYILLWVIVIVVSGIIAGTLH